MTTQKIQGIIQNFVEELSAALAEASHSAISEVLGGGVSTSSSSSGTTAKRGRPAKAAKKARGGKRSADELEQLTQSLASYVKKNPGQRIEQISKAIGTSTKELALPAKKLIADKKLSTKGQKRATIYFAK